MVASLIGSLALGLSAYDAEVPACDASEVYPAVVEFDRWEAPASDRAQLRALLLERLAAERAYFRGTELVSCLEVRETGSVHRAVFQYLTGYPSGDFRSRVRVDEARLSLRAEMPDIPGDERFPETWRVTDTFFLCLQPCRGPHGEGSWN